MIYRGVISKDSSVGLLADDNKMYRLSGGSRGGPRELGPSLILGEKGKSQKEEKLTRQMTKNRLSLSFCSRSGSTTEAYQYPRRPDYFSK